MRGQWLKSIRFKLPIIENDLSIGLDNGEHVEKKYGFKVHIAYIAEVKRSLGLMMYDASNAVEELKHPRKRPPKEKVEAITDALKYFEVI